MGHVWYICWISAWLDSGSSLWGHWLGICRVYTYYVYKNTAIRESGSIAFSSCRCAQSLGCFFFYIHSCFSITAMQRQKTLLVEWLETLNTHCCPRMENLLLEQFFQSTLKKHYLHLSSNKNLNFCHVLGLLYRKIFRKQSSICSYKN